MKKTVLLMAGLLATGVLISCSKASEDTVQQAETEVFAVHDEVMPKIDDVMKLKKQLKQRIASLDSLKANGSAATTVRTDEARAQAQRLSRDLTVADSLMMDWMSRYNSDTLTKVSSDDALRYLDEQKTQITDVKTKVNSSIEQARQFLGKK